MSYINKDGSHYSGNLFTSNIVPNKGLPEPLNNIQAANSFIPCGLKGGKRKKIYSKIKNKLNKISRKYKMTNTKKVKKLLRKFMSKTKSRTSRNRRHKTNKRNQKGGCNCGTSYGGAFRSGGTFRTMTRARANALSKALNRAKTRSRTAFRKMALARGVGLAGGSAIPNYPNGYNQYQNNMPNTPSYSLGGKLDSNLSALANPPLMNKDTTCSSCVDNYNRNTNVGFASRGWW